MHIEKRGDSVSPRFAQLDSFMDQGMSSIAGLFSSIFKTSYTSFYENFDSVAQIGKRGFKRLVFLAVFGARPYTQPVCRLFYS